MQVTVRGCSGGVGAGLKTTCLQVGERVLIDAGTGLELLTVDEMCALEHLFITHAHLDHIACLPMLLTNRPDGSPPLHVHGSSTVLEALDQYIFNWTIWPDYRRIPSLEQPKLAFELFSVGDSMQLDEVKITAMQVNHPTPTQGYLLESSTGALVFSGDTGPAPDFWQALSWVEGLRHILIDVSFPQVETPIAHASGHHTAETLAEDLLHWPKPDKPLLHITHLKPGFEELVMAECQQQLPHWPHRQLCVGDLLEF